MSKQNVKAENAPSLPTGLVSKDKAVSAAHTPLPWHVYEGGNFIKIGAQGYDEYTDREGYLGGPLLVADVEDCATDTYEEDHEKGMANARLIVRAVNSYSTMIEALRLVANINLFGNIKNAKARDAALDALALAEGEGTND